MILHNQELIERTGRCKRPMSEKNDSDCSASIKRGRCHSPGMNEDNEIRSPARFNAEGAEETKEYWPPGQLRASGDTFAKVIQTSQMPSESSLRYNFSGSNGLSSTFSNYTDFGSRGRNYDMESPPTGGWRHTPRRPSLGRDPEAYADIVKIVQDALSAKSHNPCLPHQAPPPQFSQRHWTMRNTSGSSSFLAQPNFYTIRSESSVPSGQRTPSRPPHCQFSRSAPTAPSPRLLGHVSPRFDGQVSGRMVWVPDAPDDSTEPVAADPSRDALPQSKTKGSIVDNDLFEIFSAEVTGQEDGQV